jgi:hypothetical protein
MMYKRVAGLSCYSGRGLYRHGMNDQLSPALSTLPSSDPCLSQGGALLACFVGSFTLYALNIKSPLIDLDGFPKKEIDKYSHGKCLWIVVEKNQL